MNNQVSLESFSRASELRSIANSIEALFPSAADYLRGIARELDAK